MAKYASIIGFIAFDVTEDTVNVDNETIPVLRFKMSGVGIKEQPLVSITVWGRSSVDSLRGSLNKGDYVAVHGTYKQTFGKGDTVYHGVSAVSLVHLSNEIGRDDVREAKNESEPF